MAGFNPKEHMTKLQGRDYLEVKWRVVWFREVHPTGAITTELIATEPTVIVRASVHGADGVLLAADYGTAPAAGKGTWTGRAVEKASTAATGRALALAGFGTQFDAEDETDNLADSPVEPPRKAAPAQPQEPPPNGWTMEAAQSLVTEAKHKNVTNEELLGVLGVARISEFQPGLSAARKLLADYVKARPAQPAAQEQVVF